MIEATHRKLREARFFYQHLVRQGQQVVNQEPEAFRFYFSAFIQAARSVTWVLQKEEKEKWEAWEPKWRAKRNEEEQKLLNFTNELRLDEVKRTGANTTLVWEEIAINELHELLTYRRQHPAYAVHVFAPPGTPLPETRRPTYLLEHEDGHVEATRLCKEYLALLEKMVEDFCADACPGSKGP